jgi:hypothetical protein
MVSRNTRVIIEDEVIWATVSRMMVEEAAHTLVVGKIDSAALSDYLLNKVICRLCISAEWN